MRIKFVTILFFSLSFLYRITAQQLDLKTDSTGIGQVELGEITVRASRANIKLKEMHASVSLIPSSAINKNEIHTLNDISSMAPNLFMPDYGSKLTSPVYIRGIGSRINAPSIGLYVDHIPYFEKAAFSFDFYDINRIEVLRGPQGTLFGRNTMGGIINIFTVSPMDFQGSHIRLGAGTYGQYEVSTGTYRKISPDFAFSVAANFRHNHGFFTNEYTGDAVDKLNSAGSRIRLVWKISDQATLENIAGYERSRQGGYPYALFNDSLNKAEKISYNQYSFYNRDMFSDALVYNFKSDHIEVISTTSYQLLDDLQNIDQDFTTDSLYYISQTQLQHMVSQEIIARSARQGKYHWLAGANGFYQYFNNAVSVNMYASHMELFKKYDHRISGFALFHQSALSDFLFENLTVTAGLRMDYERDILEYQYDRASTGNFQQMEDTVYPSLKSLVLLPKIALNYKIGRNNFYFVIAKGYKTGGFNSTFEDPKDHKFEPEYSWNFEGGLKSVLFKDKLYADFALYYINWINQQIYQTVPSGRGSMLKNAGHSVSKGFEATFRTITGRSSDITMAYGYTHAKYLKYVVDADLNFNNKLISYVPRHTLSIQFHKSFKIRRAAFPETVGVNLLYRGAGALYWKEDNSHRQNYYGTLDTKISLDQGRFQFNIWLKNLTDTNYEAFYFEALGNKYFQKGKPFQAGINVIYKF